MGKTLPPYTQPPTGYLPDEWVEGSIMGNYEPIKGVHLPDTATFLTGLNILQLLVATSKTGQFPSGRMEEVLRHFGPDVSQVARIAMVRGGLVAHAPNDGLRSKAHAIVDLRY
jgi:hypothetical protein